MARKDRGIVVGKLDQVPFEFALDLLERSHMEEEQEAGESREVG